MLSASLTKAFKARALFPTKQRRVHKATGDRYRARRAIVKVRVVKLRNAKSSVSRGHLAYLQREGAGEERARLNSPQKIMVKRINKDLPSFINKTLEWIP